jgi:phosphoglycolate phosphatase-like HAD superfamily hydrolase
MLRFFTAPLYLGDTAIDMKTTVSAGMFHVGVLWGFRILILFTH